MPCLSSGASLNLPVQSARQNPPSSVAISPYCILEPSTPVLESVVHRLALSTLLKPCLARPARARIPPFIVPRPLAGRPVPRLLACSKPPSATITSSSGPPPHLLRLCGCANPASRLLLNIGSLCPTIHIASLPGEQVAFDLPHRCLRQSPCPTIGHFCSPADDGRRDSGNWRLPLPQLFKRKGPSSCGQRADGLNQRPAYDTADCCHLTTTTTRPDTRQSRSLAPRLRRHTPRCLRPRQLRWWSSVAWPSSQTAHCRSLPSACHWRDSQRQRRLQYHPWTCDRVSYRAADLPARRLPRILFLPRAVPTCIPELPRAYKCRRSLQVALLGCLSPCH